MPLPLTHTIVARTRRDEEVLCESPIGFTFEQLVEDLAEGQLQHWLTLVSVHAVDFASGACSDVTVRALHEIAVHVEAAEQELPENLAAAFEAYGVPVPVQPPADWADARAA